MPIGGQQRRTGIEQAGPGYHRIGLRLAGRQRRAQRHIGRALFMAGVHGAEPLGGLEQGVEQVIVVHAGQRIDGVEAMGDQRGHAWLRRWTCRMRRAGAFFLVLALAWLGNSAYARKAECADPCVRCRGCLQGLDPRRWRPAKPLRYAAA